MLPVPVATVPGPARNPNLCEGCGRREGLRDRVGGRYPLRNYGRAAEGLMRARLCTMCSAAIFFARDDPAQLRALAALLEQAGGDDRTLEARLADHRAPEPPRGTLGLKAYICTLEAEEIRRALELADGNRSAAARQLGINRTTLLEKMERLGIQPTRTRELA